MNGRVLIGALSLVTVGRTRSPYARKVATHSQRVRTALWVCIVLLLCQGCTQQSRIHPGRAPQLPDVGVVLRLDGEQMEGRPLDLQRTYEASVAFSIPGGARVTRYWIGEPSSAQWGISNGPIGVRVLRKGGAVGDGQTLTFSWKPASKPRTMLVAIYSIHAVDGVSGLTDRELGHFSTR